MDKRLESCEAELRTKEDELFLQLERNLRLEEEVERTKLERNSCLAARERLDQEQQTALRRLHLQLDQNEITRRNLERARLDVVRQANIIREEKDALEREVSLREPATWNHRYVTYKLFVSIFCRINRSGRNLEWNRTNEEPKYVVAKKASPR